MHSSFSTVMVVIFIGRSILRWANTSPNVASRLSLRIDVDMTWSPAVRLAVVCGAMRLNLSPNPLWTMRPGWIFCAARATPRLRSVVTVVVRSAPFTHRPQTRVQISSRSSQFPQVNTTIKGIIALHHEAFTGPYEQARRDVAAGSPDTFLRPGVPWGSMWTAQAYTECFDLDNRYSVSRHAANTNCPTLFVFGSEECAGPQLLPVCGAARNALTEAGYPHVRVETVEGANHGYNDREMRLYTVISEWIDTIT